MIKEMYFLSLLAFPPYKTSSPWCMKGISVICLCAHVEPNLESDFRSDNDKSTPAMFSVRFCFPPVQFYSTLELL
jgi:hypothetical protein